MTFALYIVLAIALVYFISQRERKISPSADESATNPEKAVISGKNPTEIWKQVYETASMEEARQVRDRLESEKIPCILYEQGKKDIHGNLLKGIGIAVPASATERAQSSIVGMPV
ncbi:MAG: hypothetical protein BWY42_00007 [Candidatus Omnitrophica bacterium ADurb.Bin277]|nr:MAG: hypothetical protein BWY42_00007 [Candidatus Omnitrophica bacterium ADurb.Bin277]